MKLVTTFSLTGTTVKLLKVLSVADSRSKSAEVRFLVVMRARELLEGDTLSEYQRTAISELLEAVEQEQYER